MDNALSQNLRIMTALWNGLAAIHSARPFCQEFLSDLKRLDHFQKRHPTKNFSSLMGRFEIKVIQAFNQKFSRDQIQQFRARLNQSN